MVKILGNLVSYADVDHLAHLLQDISLIIGDTPVFNHGNKLAVLELILPCFALKSTSAFVPIMLLPLWQQWEGCKWIFLQR